MSIRITKTNAKHLEGMKLASKIVSYLFEQECGECSDMSRAEVETIRKAAQILGR